MKKIMNITSTIIAIILLTLTQAEAAMKKEVTFKSHGKKLAGKLFLPNNFKDGDKLPAAVITGAWTTVKEQMPSNYAEVLADKGYAALVFDFRGWGASEGDIKYLEDPQRKIEDIHSAVDYLATRPEVDAEKITGLGICASAGYMSDVAASHDKIKSFALVAPWLHNKEIVNLVYGGEESINSLIALAESSDNATYLEAASSTNDKSLMYQAPYYTEKDRGLIKEYDNKFNIASWKGWLNYDALKTAKVQSKPVVLIHSEAAAIPQGAKAYAETLGAKAKLIMLKEVTQFDFYDKADVIERATYEILQHFKRTLK